MLHQPMLMAALCSMRSLHARGSKLILLRGKPTEILPAVMKEWGVSKLCFEADTEPYALQRDAAVREAADAAGIEVASPVGHTLYDSAALIASHHGTPPLTYKAFEKLLKVPLPIARPSFETGS